MDVEMEKVWLSQLSQWSGDVAKPLSCCGFKGDRVPVFEVKAIFGVLKTESHGQDPISYIHLSSG